jgi:hypothetical protein
MYSSAYKREAQHVETCAEINSIPISFEMYESLGGDDEFVFPRPIPCLLGRLLIGFAEI